MQTQSESNNFLNLEWLEDKINWLFGDKDFVSVPVQFGDKWGLFYRERTHTATLYLLNEHQEDFFWFVDEEGLTVKHGNDVGLWELSFVA